MIEEIKNKEEILAIIIRNEFSKEGVSFVTPQTFPEQLAFMKHTKGKIIAPHVHNQVSRQINYTQEVLFIRRGKLQVNFYSSERVYLESVTLQSGDVILLAGGGHGFVALEDTEMIEVKQGPYVGEIDKTRFQGIEN